MTDRAHVLRTVSVPALNRTRSGGRQLRPTPLKATRDGNSHWPGRATTAFLQTRLTSQPSYLVTSDSLWSKPSPNPSQIDLFVQILEPAGCVLPACPPTALG